MRLAVENDRVAPGSASKSRVRQHNVLCTRIRWRPGSQSRDNSRPNMSVPHRSPSSDTYSWRSRSSSAERRVTINRVVVDTSKVYRKARPVTPVRQGGMLEGLLRPC